MSWMVEHWPLHLPVWGAAVLSVGGGLFAIYWLIRFLDWMGKR